jgi:hypothetical protein
MTTLSKLLAVSSVTALVACSVRPVVYRQLPDKIGGTVTGLEGSGLVLTNGGDDLAISANGGFELTEPVDRGASYAVTVKNQPANPSQICTVAQGSGTTADADVTDVQVNCSTTAFHVGGTVTGLAGAGLVLRDNGGDDLPISADGTFAFVTPVASGATYDVTVGVQPSEPTQVCTVASGAGTVGAANVTNVEVICATSTFTIGGTVTGLLGSGLVLQDNGGGDLSISGNGSFTFAAPIASGATFEVTVLSQPSLPTQTCTVSGGTGTVGSGNVTSVAINCATNRYMIGGTIRGLSGKVTLQNNGGDDLDVTSNGTFAFATSVPSGATYSVAVNVQPASPISQTCAVANGSGVVGGADVTSVVVTCTTNSFTIGGTVSGLAAGDSITLRDNGGDDLVRSADGSFAFTTPVASGATYAVTFVANPTSPVSQTCTVTNGSGTVTNANVTSVAVSCTTNNFNVGGTVTGVTGAGLVLQNNGGGDLPIPGNTTFAFQAASGTTYNITVKSAPALQTCAVTNGAGTVGNANITNVLVACTAVTWSPALFPIAVPGTGFGFGDLALDGNDDLLVAANSAGTIVRVNHTTGAQTPVASNLGNGQALAVVYRAANNTIYASDTAGQLFTITAAGNVLLATVPGALNALAIAPASFGSFAGFIIGATNQSVVAVDPTTGTVTTITSTAGAASDLAFAPDGTLYICGGPVVRTVTASGVATTFAAGFGAADGIAITSDGTKMFIADSGTDTIRLVTIPGAVVTTFAAADIDDGFFVGGLVAAPGNTLIVMTGEGALTLRGFGF